MRLQLSALRPVLGGLRESYRNTNACSTDAHANADTDQGSWVLVHINGWHGHDGSVLRA